MKFDWVPNLFYDLVGRVLPGAVILFGMALVIFGPLPLAEAMKNGWPQKMVAGFGPLGLALVLAYTIGDLAAELSHSTLRKLFRDKPGSPPRPEDLEQRLKDHSAIDKTLGRQPLSVTREELPGVNSMYGHLRLGAPSEASRLLKLRAEERLHAALSFGCLILASINAVFLRFAFSFDRTVLLGVLLLIVFASLRRRKDMHRYFVRSTCSAWLLLVSESRQDLREKEWAARTSG